MKNIIILSICLLSFHFSYADDYNDFLIKRNKLKEDIEKSFSLKEINKISDFVDKKMDRNGDKIVEKWKDYLRVDDAVKGTIEKANFYCNLILSTPEKDKAGYYGCKVGVELVKGNIEQAKFYCNTTLRWSKAGYYGCKSGLNLANNNVEQANFNCNVILKWSNPGYYGCKAGINLFNNNITQANFNCNVILKWSKAGYYGCKAGIDLTNSNISHAGFNCRMILNYKNHKSDYYSCLAGLELTKYTLKKEKSERRATIRKEEKIEKEISEKEDIVNSNIVSLKDSLKELTLALTMYEEDPSSIDMNKDTYEEAKKFKNELLFEIEEIELNN